MPFLAAQNLLRRLLLLLVVIRVTDQPVPHPMQHVHNIAERLIHLSHRVQRCRLSQPALASPRNVLRRRPHSTRLILNGLRMHLKPTGHIPHCMRIGHKPSSHHTAPFHNQQVTSNPTCRNVINAKTPTNHLRPIRSRPAAPHWAEPAPHADLRHRGPSSRPAYPPQHPPYPSASASSPWARLPPAPQQA